MQILISRLPLSGWWQDGIPKYDDNPAMVEGAIPDLNILNKERTTLISIIKENGHKVIEIDFPVELDDQNPKHDFVFIRDSFISDQNGTAIILRAGEISRRIENRVIKDSLKSLGMKIKEIPDQPGIRADGGEFYYCAKDKILFCGNGGSAADAQHISAELSGRFNFDRDPLNSEALHVNTSYLTAVANDYSFDEVYSRLVRAKASENDVLVGISTSGSSENVYKAIKTANDLGLKTVGFLGCDGGKISEICDISIIVPSNSTPRIQEAHIMIGQIICGLIEENLLS